MAITGTFEKARKDIRKTVSDPTPLYAVVGIGDVAVETVRGVRAELSTQAADFAPRALLGDVVSTAAARYGELAGRGRSLVTRVRKHDATVELGDQATSTRSKAKAATTTAKKSAAATRTATKSAGTTARKSGSNTKAAVKSAATSGRRTATAAKKAAEATAAEAGD